MRVYNNYLFSLILASSAVISFMAVSGQQDLSAYFTLNTIVFLIITLLYAQLNRRARNVLNSIGIVLFAGFLILLAIKVIDIIF